MVVENMGVAVRWAPSGDPYAILFVAEYIAGL